MKKYLVICDSTYGNTQKVGEAIAKELSAVGETRIRKPDQLQDGDLSGISGLVVGSPTQGGRPTPGIISALARIGNKDLEGVWVAAFDTRFLEKEQNFALRILMKTIGYAAPRIMKTLEEKGAIKACEPQGFIVVNKEGPLHEGELERAAKWVTCLVKDS